MTVDREGMGRGQGDLLTTLQQESWLLERLKEQGIDVYAGGPFECLRDRLAFAILDNRWWMVIVGRRDRKPETYEQLFERIYGVALKEVGKAITAKRAKAAGV